MKTDLIEQFRTLLADADADYAADLEDAEITGERPDLDDRQIELPVEWVREAADRIAALEADGWQAIDTAPKDRRILLGRFSGDKKDEYDGYCAVDRWRHPTAGYSYTGWGQFNATHWPPTHWREIGRPA